MHFPSPSDAKGTAASDGAPNCPISAEDRRELHVAEIIRFVREHQAKREEWKVEPRGDGAVLGVAHEALGKAQRRPWAINRSIIDNLAKFYRLNPRADRAPGVLVVDSLFSDNNDGCSTVSASRLGKLLSCHEKTIREVSRGELPKWASQSGDASWDGPPVLASYR